MDEVEEELYKMHEEEEDNDLNHHNIAEDTDVIVNKEEVNFFTFEVLRREADDVKLPSTLWAMHKDPLGRFVAFSRMPSVQTGRLVADKAVVFSGRLVPSIFFREMKLKLPLKVSTQPLDSLHQVSAYLQKIHRLAFCGGTGLQDPIRSIKCRIYVDMPSLVRRCTACSSRRQTAVCAARENKT